MKQVELFSVISDPKIQSGTSEWLSGRVQSCRHEAISPMSIISAVLLFVILHYKKRCGFWVHKNHMCDPRSLITKICKYHSQELWTLVMAQQNIFSIQFLNFLFKLYILFRMPSSCSAISLFSAQRYLFESPLDSCYLPWKGHQDNKEASMSTFISIYQICLL